MSVEYSKASMVAYASAALVGTAGVETTYVENLPKGALLLVVSLLFGAVGYFFKRDYKKITDHQAETNAQLAAQKASLDHLATMFHRVDDKYERTSNRVAVLESKAGISNG
jgi:hypothetical protein